MEQMKAIICTKYGAPEVLQFKEVDKPCPKDNEVLIKVIAATVHIGDTKIRRFEPGLGAIKDFFFKPMMRIMVGFRQCWHLCSADRQTFWSGSYGSMQYCKSGNGKIAGSRGGHRLHTRRFYT